MRKFLKPLLIGELAPEEPSQDRGKNVSQTRPRGEGREGLQADEDPTHRCRVLGVRQGALYRPSTGVREDSEPLPETQVPHPTWVLADPPLGVIHSQPLYLWGRSGPRLGGGLSPLVPLSSRGPLPLLLALHICSSPHLSLLELGGGPGLFHRWLHPPPASRQLLSPAPRGPQAPYPNPAPAPLASTLSPHFRCRLSGCQRYSSGSSLIAQAARSGFLHPQSPCLPIKGPWVYPAEAVSPCCPPPSPHPRPCLPAMPTCPQSLPGLRLHCPDPTSPLLPSSQLWRGAGTLSCSVFIPPPPQPPQGPMGYPEQAPPPCPVLETASFWGGCKIDIR